MDKIIGCGIDIEELSRFEKYFKGTKDLPQLIKDIFTEEEIKNNIKYNPLLNFILGFSCKEAVFKSFGQSWTNSEIFWKDIEFLVTENVLDQKKTGHEIRLNNYALELYEKLKCNNIISSFSYNKNFVFFKVILRKIDEFE
jgi:phosphopantetheine--protein transferase-like protein